VIQDRPDRRDWRRRRRGRRWTPLLVFLTALIVYNLNGRVIASSDTRAARFLPLALLESGTLRLDPVLAVAQTSRHTYWLLPARGGGHASLFPIVAPLLVTPLYVPAALMLARHGWEGSEVAAAAAWMEKASASCVAALAATLMYLLLLRRLDAGRALGLTVAFALGTETWMIGSQALWQHGTEELLLIGALLALTGPLGASRLGLGGLLCGLAIAARPIDALLVAPFAVLAPLWTGRRSVWFFAAAALPLGLMLAYDLEMFGMVGGGYSVFIQAGRRYFENPLLRGLVEMLFSPDKGLFVYTPFLIFLPIYLRRAVRGVEPATAAEPVPLADGDSAPREDGRQRGQRQRDRALTWGLLVGIVAELVVYARSEWRGGACYGPRYLTDIVPLSIWMLAPVVAGLRDRPLRLFRGAVAFSIAVQAIGAFCYPRGASDLRMYAEHSLLPAYLIEAEAGPETPGWLDTLRGGGAGGYNTRP
jgi:hypothetical protein